MRTAKRPASSYLHLCISLALMLLFGMLPPIGGITQYGMVVLGIFLGTIYGWIVSDAVWPSFLGLVALVLVADYAASVSSILSAMLSDGTVVSIIAAFFVSGIVVLSGAAEWVGRWFISRPIIKSRPWFMIALIFVAGFVVCPFTPVTWIVFMFELIGIINAKLGYEPKSRFAQIMIYSIVFSSQIVFFIPTQVVWLVSEGLIGKYSPGFTFGIYPMMPLGLILSVVLSIGSFLALVLVFRLDISGLKDEQVAASIQPPPPINKQQKISLIMLLSYLSLLVLSALLPSHWLIVAALKKLGVSGLALICTVLAIIIRVDGKPLASFAAVTGYMSWSMVFMVGTAIIMAGALTAAETGISVTLAGLLTPLFSGFSPYMFTLVILVATMVLTNLINNIVVLSIMLPTVMTIAPAIGVNVNAVFPLLCFAAYMAIMLPSANPVAALLHSNTKQMDSKEIIKFSWVSIAASTVIFALIGIPLANFFY